MKNNSSLRRIIKIYLKHPRAFTQNELARRCSMGKQTLSDFLNNKHNGITAEQEKKILDIIVPWERDPVCVAGRLKTSLLKQYFSQDEISRICEEVAWKVQTIA